MGLFGSSNKRIGTVYIKFYGEDKASVEYETQIKDKETKEADLTQLFPFYYAKMLFNLNRGEFADQLIVYVQEVIAMVLNKKGQIKRPNILSSSQKLIEPKNDDITKKYSGEFYEKSNEMRFVTTHMDQGGENYYSPISTIMFLQYIIKKLPENHLFNLVLIVAGMNRYYQEADYSEMNSIIEAPIYGLEFALKELKRVKNR